MKPSVSVLITATILLAALTTSTRLNSQSNPAGSSHKYHHYKLIDMGTFDGPQSYVTSPDLTVEADVNNHGVLAGWADTSAHDPFPGFCFNDDCRVSHAFQWRHGVKNNLGALTDGVSSASSWISANGLIAGVSENGEVDPLIPGFPEVRAVLWRNGNISNLGTLPEGGHESFANAVNSRGQVIGGALNDIPDPNSMVGLGYETRAFLWENGVMQDLGTLPGGTDAQALLVNERGEVLGWSYTSSVPSVPCASLGVGLSLTTGSFLWDKEHGMVDVGGFGGTCTLASGLNNRGQVAGGSYLPDLPGGPSSRAFVWDRATGLKELPTLGGDNAGAFAINDAGEAVGGSWLEGNLHFHAALWGESGITDLGVVTGDCDSYAFGINSSGQVVGSSFICAPSDATRGFLWEDGGPMVDLNALIVPHSSLYVSLGASINDRGEIAAPGFLPNADQHAVLLIPCDEKHPGVDGCDYSLVDEIAATRVSPAPVMQRPASAIQSNSVRQILQRRLGPWSRMPGLMRESQLQKSTSNTTSSSAPIVALSATSLTFATQTIDTTSSAKMVALKNTGTASLTIAAIAIVGINAADFAQTHTCGSSLAAGASCRISVTFKPTASGTRTAALSISDNAAGSPQKATLSGIGTTAKLYPSHVNFGSVAIGTTSSPQTVTLTNVGMSTLTISGIAISGTDTGVFAQTNECGTSLAPSASCSISVTFKPIASGTRMAALSVTDNAATSPQKVALSGIGTTAKLSPISLSFGTVAIETPSVAKTVTLTNVGATSLTITGIAITGTNPGDFAQTNTCGISLTAGASCSTSVTFNPTASGARMAALSIRDNAAGSPQKVALSGTGEVSSGPTLNGDCLSGMPGPINGCRITSDPTECPPGKRAVKPETTVCGVGGYDNVDGATSCHGPYTRGNCLLNP